MDAQQKKAEIVSDSVAVPAPEASHAYPLENWSQLPKRKPVPPPPPPPPTKSAAATGVASAQPISNVNYYSSAKETGYSSSRLKWSFPSIGFSRRRFSRKFIIIGIVLAILLLALILGLAIGLTVGKK